MAFTQPVEAEALPDIPMWEEPWFWDIGKQLLGGIVLLLLIFGLLRPMMRSLVEKAPVPEGAAPAAAAGTTMLTAEQLEAMTPEQRAMLEQEGAEDVAQMLQPPEKSHQDKIQELRGIAEQEPQLVAEVLKGWVEDDENN